MRRGGRKRGHLAAYHGEARTGSPGLLPQAPSLPPSVPFGDLLPTCQAVWGPSESLSSEIVWTRVWQALSDPHLLRWPQADTGLMLGGCGHLSRAHMTQDPLPSAYRYF